MTLLYLQIKLNEETMTIQVSQTFIPCKLRLAWYRVHKYEYKYKYTNT